MRWEALIPHCMGLTLPIPYCGICVGLSTSSLYSVVVQVWSRLPLTASRLLSSPICANDLGNDSGGQSGGRPPSLSAGA